MVLLSILLLIGGIKGCGSGGSVQERLKDPDPPRGDGNLYVANSGTGSLLTFDSATTADGDLFPHRHFPETLAGPAGLVLDRTTDTLYVANTGQNAILIYENAGALRPPAGAASATRVISGPLTRLHRPSAVAYDAARRLLYVSNEGDSSLLVFHTGCTASATLGGNIAPCQVIAGPSTRLNAPGALSLDPDRDILYLSNREGEAVLIYDQASGAGGAPADCGKVPDRCDLPPTRTLTSPPDAGDSALRRISGLVVDSGSDRLYLARGGSDPPAILIYDHASDRSGAGLPDLILAGPGTLLSAPSALAVDAVQEQLFALDNNYAGGGRSAVVVFSNIHSRCSGLPCDLPPDRVITGDQTGLSTPAGIAVDSQLERIYVSDGSTGAILLFALEGNLAPIRLNAGANTRLEQPISFFYDSPADRLYVLNYAFRFSGTGAPAITVYDNVSTASLGNTAPSWTLSDPTLRFPRALYIDRSRKYLLILEWFSSELRVYDLAAVLANPPTSGNTAIAPIASFTNGLTAPTALAVDEEKGEAYVANDAGPTNPVPSIAVYNLNTLANTPKRTLAGPNTRLVRPFGLFIDPARSILYVTDLGSNMLLAFDQADIKSGDVAPTRAVSSQTLLPSDKLATPIAPFMNVAKDRLFLISRNNDAVYIFDRASTLNGEAAPNRRLSGSNTKLIFSQQADPAFTGALWVDTGHGGERIFVGEPKDPGCTAQSGCPRGAFLLFSAEGNIAPGQTWSGGENRLVGPQALAVDPIRDLLYVANQGDPASTADDSIVLFAVASRSDGNLPLTGTVTVTGGASNVAGTGTAFLTELSPGDRIKIGTTSLMISTISSDTSLTLVAPYSGPAADGQTAFRLPRILCSPTGTTCTSPDTKLNNPAGLVVDPDQNRLYVANAGTDCSNPAAPCNAILVFHTASHLNNNAVPEQVITSPALNGPRGLALDPARKTLYVANNGGRSVLLFRNVEGVNGSVLPAAEIGGEVTQIDAPVGVAYDLGRDLLYVLNQGPTPRILVFSGASSLNGNVAPARAISGSLMVAPTALFLDAAGDLLYVADRDSNTVFVYPEASHAQGEAVHKTIHGNNTGLHQPTALAVDTAR